MKQLTPEFLLALYSQIPDPPEFLGSLIRRALAGSEKSQQLSNHLLPLFDRKADRVRYWDLYLAHWRWVGVQHWNSLREAASVDFGEAIARLPQKASPEDWGLAEALCEASRRLAASDLDASVKLAKVALRLARRAPVEILGNACRHELRALAWATLANAHRAHDQLDCARESMSHALRHLDLGQPHLLGLAPAVLSLRAGLEYWERHFHRSLDTLAEALNLNPSDSLQARLLVQRSASLIALEEPFFALETLRKALGLIDRAEDPRLWCCAVQHQLTILTDLRRFEEAGNHLQEVTQLVAAVGGPVDRIRVRWIEARMANGQGDPKTAEVIYNEVRQGFMDHEMAYSAAIVTIEMAELLLQQGRLEEVKIHAAATLQEFRRLRIESHYISALTLVEQAVIGQRLTSEILRQARNLIEWKTL